MGVEFVAQSIPDMSVEKVDSVISRVDAVITIPGFTMMKLRGENHNVGTLILTLGFQ
jgi:hypothetical protein